MRRHILFYLMGGLFLFAPALFAQQPEPSPKGDRMVSLDFDNVDLPVLVKFIGELTGKNFVIDEQVRGKITIFSPVKIPAAKAYDVFLSVLDLKGFTVIPDGEVYEILPLAAAPPPRSIHMYTLENTEVDEMSKVLLGLIGRAGQPTRPKSKTPQEITGNVQMVTDKSTNRLIITASDEDYKIVEGMIKQLDIKRRQVYVEAVVLEMAADKLRELGTDLGALFGYTKSEVSDLLLVGGLNETPPTLQGFTSLLASSATSTASAFEARPINTRAVLKALQSTPNVNVLSTPQILTSDREKAEIVVAQNVPFPGAQSQSVGGNVQTTVERKDVGIILRLTPTVMENQQVKLDLYQEISAVVETAAVGKSDVNLGPTTNKRSANTKVLVRDGQTAVIGGLIKDNLIKSTRSIPFLGAIPVLGWLFKSETTRIEKTNLLIFVTPYIVPEAGGENSLDAIREKKVKGTLSFMEKNKLGGSSERGEFLNNMINPPK